MPLRRPAAALALTLLSAGLLTVAPATTAAAASPDLVVSQVYGGGGNAGATYTHDYVELFNRSGAAVSLSGRSLQYASATGTGAFTAFPLPAASVPAGGRFLVQFAGGTTGAALPPADATGALDLSSTAGKVALADGATGLGCNGSSSPCTPAQLARIVDLVGYGSATFFEGSAAAPAASSSTAVLRAGAGCTDTDRSAADSTAAAPSPRTSASW